MSKNLGVLESWFTVEEKPKWREEFETKMYKLEDQTGLTRKELLKVADAMELLKIIRL